MSGEGRHKSIPTGIEIARTELIRVEASARIERREALRRILQDITKLVINTGKEAKALAALQMIQALIAPELSVVNGGVLQLPSDRDEPAAVRAEDVARYKAETARHEYIESRFPEIEILLSGLHTALYTQNEQLFHELLRGIIFLGADINAFINGQQHHKWARQYGVALPEFAYDQLQQELYDTYVTPQNGVVQVTWEASTALVNGHTKGFSDWIEIIARPLDKELVDKYLAKAVTDGKVLSSNTHLAAFEMLCESGRILTIAMASKEMLQRGYVISQFRQSPKPELLAAAMRSIHTNATVYVP